MLKTLDEYARDLLDDGKVPNQAAWLTKDKDWMKERKVAWNEIKKRLIDERMAHVESSGGTPKRKLRIYERYFLKGILPSFDPFGDVPVCLLFLVWWHPDSSETNWQLIKDVIRHIGGLYCRNHYSDSVNMLIENSDPINFSEADGFQNGFFLGMDERLWNYFINNDVKSRLVAFDPDQPQVKFSNHENIAYYGGIWMTQWLTAPSEYVNSNTIFQSDRFLEYWYSKLTDKSLEAYFRHEGGEQALRKFLSQLINHKSSDPVKARTVYVNKIRTILDNRPLESTIRRIWSEVKESAKL
jgi:hypothetical protein